MKGGWLLSVAVAAFATASAESVCLEGNGRNFAEFAKPPADIRWEIGKLGDFVAIRLSPAPAATNRIVRRIALPPIKLLPFATEPMAVGSGGLTKVDGHSGSFGFLAIAEPRSRRGVVVGWLTNEKLSGVIRSGFGDAARRAPVLDIFGEYGRMLVPAGAQVRPDTVLIGTFDDCRLGLEQYADLVAEHYAIKLPKPLAGYTTWYDDKFGYSHKSERWPKGCGCGTAESAREFAAAVRRCRLHDYGFDFYQIDDHWQAGNPDINGPARNFFEIRKDGPFPAGFAAMNASFAALGVRTGIWFMPFGGLSKEPFFADKQHIFARAASTYRGNGGAAASDAVGIAASQRAGTPFETVWGGTVVDVTSAAGRDYVARLGRLLTCDWGFRYLKYDGIWTGHGGDLAGGRTWRNDHYDQVAWADPTKTGVEALRLGLETLRAASAPGTFLLGCNLAQNARAMVASYGLTDGMRIGGDNGPIDVFPERYLAGPLAATPRYFLNGRVWYNDPDPVYVRDAVPLDRARMFASWTGLNGTLYNFSDYLPTLSEGRIEILKRTLTPHGKLAVRPIDYFERSICNVWTLDGGTHKVVGIFNWSTNSELKVDYDFAYLDLNPAATYVGWDFWANRPLPPFARRLKLTVPPDSCRILQLVTTDLTKAVLVSTSRHVASPILETREKSTNGMSITGVSRLVKDDECELRFFTPDGRFERRTIKSEHNGDVAWKFDLSPTNGAFKSNSEPVAHFERMQFNNPGLEVPLSVGIWPKTSIYDYDRDGHLDLIVSASCVPIEKSKRGEICRLYRNIDNFLAQTLGPVPKNVGPVPKTLGSVPQKVGSVPKGEVVPPKAFKSPISRWPARSPAPLPSWREVPHPREKTMGQAWYHADFDGDGVEDALAMATDWFNYGKVGPQCTQVAYDAKGVWTNSIIETYAYFFKGTVPRNVGTVPKWESARRISCEGSEKPFLVGEEDGSGPYGGHKLLVQDFDGDGDLDLITAEFVDSFWYFENIGERGEFKLAKGRQVVDPEGKPIAVDLCMYEPNWVDLNGDGRLDIVAAEEDGSVGWFENTGKVDKRRTPVFVPRAKFRELAQELKFGCLATPFGVDWDGDGDWDFVAGNSAGYLAFIENLSGPGVERPQWAAPRLMTVRGKPIRTMAGENGSPQGPSERKWGYSGVSCGDWDGDGILDAVVNDINGEVLLYRGLKRGGTEMAPAAGIEVEWPGGIQPQASWEWRPNPGKCLRVPWRTTVEMIDFNRDGLLDLVIFDFEGYLCVYERYCDRQHKLRLHAPRRAFLTEAGKPYRSNYKPAGANGRSRFRMADWTGDGEFDILSADWNAVLYEQVGHEHGQRRFKRRRPVGQEQLQGHTCCPTVVDFNNDGILDCVIAAEDGYFYYLRNGRAK